MNVDEHEDRLGACQ